jgi:GNAT superfamily N-acetyltransferase
MKRQFNIRPLLNNEIGMANSLIPVEWHFDFKIFPYQHFGEGTYEAFGGFVDNQIIAVGDLIINGKTGWLGNIVVKPEFRTQGFGQELTMHLVNYLKNHECKNIITMATESSKSLYKKLGFLTSSIFSTLEGQLPNAPAMVKQIRPVEPDDLKQIYALDASVTGEDRSKLFNSSISKGFVYTSADSRKIQGFFLSETGEGPIIASNSEAGLALLQLKHSLSLCNASIPCENRSAVDYLKKNHFHETDLVYRMALGEDIDWKPEMMFSRAFKYSA